MPPCFAPLFHRLLWMQTKWGGLGIGLSYIENFSNWTKSLMSKCHRSGNTCYCSLVVEATCFDLVHGQSMNHLINPEKKRAGVEVMQSHPLRMTMSYNRPHWLQKIFKHAQYLMSWPNRLSWAPPPVFAWLHSRGKWSQAFRIFGYSSILLLRTQTGK